MIANIWVEAEQLDETVCDLQCSLENQMEPYFTVKHLRAGDLRPHVLFLRGAGGGMGNGGAEGGAGGLIGLSGTGGGFGRTEGAGGGGGGASAPSHLSSPPHALFFSSPRYQL